MTRDLVIAYRDDVVRRCGVATAYRRFCVARKAIAWLGLPENPFDQVQAPPSAAGDGLTPGLTKDQVLRLLSAPPYDTALGRRDRLILLMLFNMGLRLQELVGATVESLGEDGRHVFLRVTRKGGKEQALKIPPYVADELRSYLKSEGISSGRLFRSMARGALRAASSVSGRAVENLVKKYARRAGLDPARVRPHVGRVFFITEAFTRSKDLVKVQRFVGHASPRQTEKYIRTQEDLDDSAVDYVRLVPRAKQPKERS